MLSGPNMLIVIGDAEHWSTQHRSMDLGLDSRLRCVRHDFANVAWRTACAAMARAAGPTKRYARLRVVALATPATVFFGLVKSGFEATVATNNFPGGIADSVGMRSTEIWRNGVSVQSGLAAIAAGDSLGLTFGLVGSTPTVQFYRNDAPYGAPVTLSAGLYRLAAGSSAVGNEVILDVDRGDLPTLPAESQPWGVAVRVADAGGYSPAASRLDPARVSAAGLLIDAYGRVVRGTTAPGWRSVATDRVIRAAAAPTLTYVELLAEDALDACHFGLMVDGTAIPAFAGEGAQNWGYDIQGYRWTANAAVAVAGAAANGIAGKRPGLLWDRVSKAWLVLDGLVLGGGDPRLGTGAAWTNVIGNMRILVSQVFADGKRARVLTHAREQLVRPSYADAADGADVLPELHFEDRLAGETHISQSVHFAFPWGGTNRSEAPVGAVELGNEDGNFDFLLGAALRDEDVAVYDLQDGFANYAARANVESIAFNGETRMRVVTRSRLAKLDTRIDADAVAFGMMKRADTISRASLSYQVAHDGYFTIADVRDKGGTVSTWASGRLGVNGFVRTGNPTTDGRHSVYDFIKWTPIGETVVPNGDFATWGGGVPSTWTVQHTPATSLVSQNGSGARMQRAIGAPVCRLSQGVACHFVQFDVIAYTKGDVQSGTRRAGVSGTGTYFLRGSCSLEVIEDSDLTIDNVRAFTASQPTSSLAILTQFMESICGLQPSEWTYDLYASALDLPFFGGQRFDRPLRRAWLEEVFGSMAMTTYTDPRGRLVVVPFLTPNSPVATLEETDFDSDISVREDLASALAGRMVAGERNFALHRSDEVIQIGGDTELLKEASYIENISPYLHPFFSFAANSPVQLTPLYAEASGPPIHTRLRNVYGGRPLFVDGEVPLGTIPQVRLWQALTLKHSRYGFSAGRVMRLVSRRRSSSSSIERITLWG